MGWRSRCEPKSGITSGKKLWMAPWRRLRIIVLRSPGGRLSPQVVPSSLKGFATIGGRSVQWYGTAPKTTSLFRPTTPCCQASSHRCWANPPFHNWSASLPRHPLLQVFLHRILSTSPRVSARDWPMPTQSGSHRPMLMGQKRKQEDGRQIGPCYTCNQMGHLAANCQKGKGKGKGKGKNSKACKAACVPEGGPPQVT